MRHPIDNLPKWVLDQLTEKYPIPDEDDLEMLNLPPLPDHDFDDLDMDLLNIPLLDDNDNSGQEIEPSLSVPEIPLEAGQNIQFARESHKNSSGELKRVDAPVPMASVQVPAHEPGKELSKGLSELFTEMSVATPQPGPSSDYVGGTGRNAPQPKPRTGVKRKITGEPCAGPSKNTDSEAEVQKASSQTSPYPEPHKLRYQKPSFVDHPTRPHYSGAGMYGKNLFAIPGYMEAFRKETAEKRKAQAEAKLAKKNKRGISRQKKQEPEVNPPETGGSPADCGGSDSE